MTAPVHPELAALLPILESSEVVRYADAPMAQARAAHDASVARLTPPAARTAVASVQDITIPGPAGELTVRVYRPDTDAPAPVMVWLHGGGWCTGSLDTGDVVARQFCAGLPAVVVSVQYRLAPENPWPAGLDDAAVAFNWATEHALEFGGDPDRLVIGGDSAGGNLTAALVHRLLGVGRPVTAQVLLYPALDLDLTHTQRYPSMATYAHGYTLPPENWAQAVHQYVPADIDAGHPQISPLAAHDMAGLPATVLAIAECDPLSDQGRRYAERLQAASVPVAFHEGKGLIHGAFDLVGSAPGVLEEMDRVLTSTRALLRATPHQRSVPTD